MAIIQLMGYMIHGIYSYYPIKSKVLLKFGGKIVVFSSFFRYWCGVFAKVEVICHACRAEAKSKAVLIIKELIEALPFPAPCAKKRAKTREL